jgi:hypothetical protein
LRLISIVEGELAAPWRRTCRLKPLIFALVETPLPVRKARPFPRQPYDWRALLAAIGEGLEHITLVALLDYLDVYGLFRHWMTTTRCLWSRSRSRRHAPAHGTETPTNGYLSRAYCCWRRRATVRSVAAKFSRSNARRRRSLRWLSVCPVRPPTIATGAHL